MGTVIRTSISEKNKWFITKHKYLELKHFCLQYPEWKKEYLETEYNLVPGGISNSEVRSTDISDKTADIAIERAKYGSMIKLIEDTAMKADDQLYNYILKAVTENYSYPYLRTKLDMPCGKDMFYDRYRKFFYLLAQER